ncbi:DNAJB8, partial [Symbiodinium necroappetens]
GVAYRRSPNLTDREGGYAGPSYDDIVPVEMIQGQWARCAKGWLPMRLDGCNVFELLDGILRARCISSQGVAFRKSPTLEDREQMVMGPVFQEVVDAVERVGTWIRCQNGWLPLAIGGQPVFELFADFTEKERRQTVQVQASDSEGSPPPWLGFLDTWTWFLVRTSCRWGFSFATSSPRLTLSLAAMSGISLWVTVSVARMMLRGWWWSLPSLRL